MSEGSGEDRLIQRHFAPLASHPAALGLTDDAAVLTAPERSDLVLTVDAVVGGVHFFETDPPDLIARKALRVNLSDLAAKGAHPLGFLLTLALPPDIEEAWIARFAGGLREDAAAFGCPLFGGDTTRTSGPVTISITAIGALPDETMVRRSGAAPGDLVLVTGTIGDAALGLKLRAAPGWASALGDAQVRHLESRYLLPQPRNGLAGAVRAFASAAMDVSDGLIGDLAKLCRVSGVSGMVEAASVPLSPAAAAALAAEPALLETILTGGDDYEIVCTVPPARLRDMIEAAAVAGIPITVIGRIEPGHAPLAVYDAQGQAVTLRQPAFSHFR
jgi:thiamine-monophosphate kinase